MRTYNQLEQAVLQLEYFWYSKELELNFIWERTNDEITNKFTDWLHVAFKREGQDIVLSIPATTKPGLKGSIDSPITHEGITGTAIIIPGQYVKAWRFRDVTNEFSKYPYFRQCGPVNYWRDGDRDLVVDHVQQQDNKIFGTHWHVMSQTGSYGSGLVNNWSLGCMGSPEPEFKKILSAVRESVKIHGDIFTGTILESKDF